MKNWIRALTITFSIASTSALAAQFEIYVAQPMNQEASTSEFAGLLQKSLYLDTTTKTLRVPIAPLCAAKQLCAESIHWANYSLTSAKFENRSLSRVTAILNSSEIEVSVTADHSTLITIYNSKGSVQARFVGSPAQPTRFFN